MRSKLFVPGVRPDLFGKAWNGQADAVSFDLEDAVADARKAEARVNVAAFLQAQTRGAGAPLAIVRTNAPDSPEYEADLAAVLGERTLVIARELTKLYEECVRGALDDLAVDPRLDAPKGEIVVVVGPGEEVQATEADADAALIDALQTLSTGDAASEVAKALGLNRKTLYRRALELKGK